MYDVITYMRQMFCDVSIFLNDVNAENTLLYFYSAVFQGFAALLTLGSMFYLYFTETYQNQIERIEEELKRQYNQQRDVLNAIYMEGIIQYSRKEVKRHDDQENPRLNTMRDLIQHYDKISETNMHIKNKIPTILNFSIIILSISLLALFSIGYNPSINTILFFVGIILIIFSFYNLIKIKNVITLILKYKSD